jgi:hypothetical protein
MYRRFMIIWFPKQKNVIHCHSDIIYLISSFGWDQSFLPVVNIHRDGRGPTTFFSPWRVFEHERNQKDCSEHKQCGVIDHSQRALFGFHQRNRDLDVSTFSMFWPMKFVHFNQTFGTTITRDAANNAGVMNINGSSAAWQVRYMKST